jgi:hypothetical protein
MIQKEVSYSVTFGILIVVSVAAVSGFLAGHSRGLKMGVNVASRQATAKVTHFYKLLDQQIVKGRLAMHHSPDKKAGERP